MFQTCSCARAVRLLVALVCACFALQAGAQAARAEEPPLLLYTSDGLDGTGSIAVMGIDFFAARLTVERRGRLIVDQTGPTRWPHTVRVPVAPRPGDVIRVYALPSSTPMLRTTWAGLPALDECRIGEAVARGRGLGAPGVATASVAAALNGVEEPATVTEIAPWGLELLLPRALTESDFVRLEFNRTGASHYLSARVVRRAGECGRAFQVRAPEPYDARTLIRPGRLTSLFDANQDPRFAYITAVVGCAPRSRVSCEGYLRIETLGDGAPAVRLAQEEFSVSPGVLTTVNLTASDAVGPALSDGPIAVRVIATTWNQAGQPVVRSRVTTLREINLPYPGP